MLSDWVTLWSDKEVKGEEEGGSALPLTLPLPPPSTPRSAADGGSLCRGRPAVS